MTWWTHDDCGASLDIVGWHDETPLLDPATKIPDDYFKAMYHKCPVLFCVCCRMTITSCHFRHEINGSCTGCGKTLNADEPFMIKDAQLHCKKCPPIADLNGGCM